MNEMLTLDDRTAEQDRRIAQAVAREGSRLQAFIRRRVADAGDAEDILQEVLYELVEAVRLTAPIEQVGAWLFRVARNRITDLFRKRRPEALGDLSVEDQGFALGDLLPAPGGGPEAELARGVLLEELEAALAELPEEQRKVFIAHEIEGRGFKELAAETGVGINTLLSRKHYAVLHLRRRLRDIHDELQRLGASAP
jgi:RNA polymerase sigma factor (sigma-70 family)